MKTISSLFLLISIALLANGQAKKVELFEIIKSLAPDSLEAGVIPLWAHAARPANPLILKGNPEMNKVTKKYLLTQEVTIAINGKTFVCGGNTNSCNWSVSLEGNSTSYSQLSISPDLSQDVSYQTTIEYLFGKNKYKAKLLKKCDDTSDMATYEIKIPGKKTFWIQSYMSGGTEGSAIYINCYFDRKELNPDCI